MTNTDRIQELERSLISLQSDFTYLKQAHAELASSSKERDSRVAELERENALLKQRLDDHIKGLETWSGRLWAFILLLLGTVLSLASGLIVTLVRK